MEELAANLKTLSEAKREDDEADCFWPDAELPGDAIAFGMRVEGKSDAPTKVSGWRVLCGKVLVSPLYAMTETSESRFGFVWAQPSIHSHGTNGNRRPDTNIFLLDDDIEG